MTGETPRQKPLVSIVVPAFQETGLEHILARYGRLERVEVIFALAEEDTQTIPPARAAHTRSAKGRAAQMNAAAATASGDILLFLHADTSIPPEAMDLVRQTLKNPEVAAGAFQLRVDGPGWWFPFISAVANLRSRLLSLPFGDQAVFMAKSTFQKIGGYQPVPILEDVRLIEAAAKLGRIAIIPATATTSPRKWLAHGRLATTAHHWLLMLRYWLQSK